jgi:protein disulfide-isomerase A1
LPEFEAAAEVLNKKDISLAAIDCTNATKLCDGYNISSYPALKVFRGAESITRYREARNAKKYVLALAVKQQTDLCSIISYMIRQILPPVSGVDETNFEELISLEIPLLLAYLDRDDQQSRDLFKSLSEKHESEFIFGTTLDISLAEEDIAKPPFVILYSPMDEVPKVLNGPLDKEKIEHLMGTVSTPLIGKFDVKTYYDYTQVTKPLHPPSDY